MRPSLLCLFVLLPSLAIAAPQTGGSSCTLSADAQNAVDFGYKTSRRRGNTVVDVTKAYVGWEPASALADLTSCDLASASLFWKAFGDDEWTEVTSRPRAEGTQSRWYIEVKPCLTYNFAIRVGGLTLEAAGELGPAPDGEAQNSRYRPSEAKGFTADVGTQVATLSWDGSRTCADRYDLYYREVGGEESKWVDVQADNTPTASISGLRPCASYEATVISVLGDEEGGELIRTFATKPRLDAASAMDVKVVPTLNGASVELGVSSAPCIVEYEVSVCGADQQCSPTTVVKKTPGVPSLVHTVGGLNPCTDYTANIRPLYPDAEVESRSVTFRTSSPNAGEVNVGQVTALAGETSGQVRLSWPSVQCASAYKIFQQETSSYEWKQVGTTQGGDETAITVENVTPCTEFRFAVSAALDGRDTEKSLSNEVMSELEGGGEFEAPNLAVANEDRAAHVAWDHADCIASYVVTACTKEGESVCVEEIVEPDRGQKKINQVGKKGKQ